MPPRQLGVVAGREHGRTIPFSDMRTENMMQRSSRNDVEYRGEEYGHHDRAGRPLLDGPVGEAQQRERHGEAPIEASCG